MSIRTAAPALVASPANALTYEGTQPSDALQQAIRLDALRDSGITVEAAAVASPIRIERGTGGAGKQITCLLNYSATPQTVRYTGIAAQDLLTKKAMASGADVQIARWDVVIGESGR